MKKCNVYGIKYWLQFCKFYNVKPVVNEKYSIKIFYEPLAVDLVHEETKGNQVTSNAGGSEEMIQVKNAHEQVNVTDVPVMDNPEVHLEEDDGRKLDVDQSSRNEASSAGGTADSTLVCNKDNHSMISHFPLENTITSQSKKKLLVLDVNGLLADIVEHVPFGYEPDAYISKKSG